VHRGRAACRWRTGGQDGGRSRPLLRPWLARRERGCRRSGVHNWGGLRPTVPPAPLACAQRGWKGRGALSLLCQLRTEGRGRPTRGRGATSVVQPAQRGGGCQWGWPQKWWGQTNLFAPLRREGMHRRGEGEGREKAGGRRRQGGRKTNKKKKRFVFGSCHSLIGITRHIMFFSCPYLLPFPLLLPPPVGVCPPV
jgi:hypothetical protein